MNVTDKAIAEINRINPSDYALRAAVVGGGCSGMSYKLSFIDGVTNNGSTGKDEFVDYTNNHGGHGIILIDPKSYLFLKDVTLDFSDGLDGKGFEFVNPAAKRTCGCGSSFST